MARVTWPDVYLRPYITRYYIYCNSEGKHRASPCVTSTRTLARSQLGHVASPFDRHETTDDIRKRPPPEHRSRSRRPFRLSALPLNYTERRFSACRACSTLAAHLSPVVNQRVDRCGADCTNPPRTRELKRGQSAQLPKRPTLATSMFEAMT